MEKLSIRTTTREELYDITNFIRAAILKHGWQDGAILVFCPHTSCGLTINEGTDPDVKLDITHFFSQLVPTMGWRHAEGNSDAHIKSSILGASLLLPIENNELCLGTWQSLFLYEGDGPRVRSLWLQFLGTATILNQRKENV